MYELTLCLPADKQKCICEFSKNIEKDIKDNSGIIVKQNLSGKSYLALAVEDKQKDYLKSLVLDFILKVVIEDYKFNYFKEHLISGSNAKVTEAFLMAVSIFDAEIDRDVITSQLELSGEIVVDSFYHFKLQSLKDRWHRTANIINQNGVMNNENSMIDVIRYLCAVSDNNSVLVNLMFVGGQIELKNYFNAKKFKVDHNGISSLYAEMIKLNPMKINIKFDDGEPEFEEVMETLKSVFEDKIYFN